MTTTNNSKKTSRIGSKIYESHFSMAKIFDKFHPLHPDLEVLVSESTWEVLKAKLWATPRKACEGVIRGDVDELVVFHQPMGCFWNLVNNGTNYQPPSTGEFTGCLKPSTGMDPSGNCFSSWWFQPIWKLRWSKWLHLPQGLGWNFQKLWMKAPPSWHFEMMKGASVVWRECCRCCLRCT